MPRARLAMVAAAVAFGLLWRPIVRPAWQAAIVVADLYSPQLVGTNVAAWLTPEPRVSETREIVGGTEMRVTRWRPGWGGSHPALLVINGASPYGNDNAATRSLGVALARAGYLVMLPELPFLVEGRLEPTASRYVAAAYDLLRRSPETAGSTVGAFGASVGGSLLLAAAGREPALRDAGYLVVLGAYFDVDTYVASVVSETQRLDGALVRWVPDEDARVRVPPAVVSAAPVGERGAVADALREGEYDAVLARVATLPAGARAALDAVSPSATWSNVRPPVFWIHDRGDDFEPFAEALAARDARRTGEFHLLTPGLVQHAEPGEMKEGGPLALVRELAGLIGFATEILRIAG